MESAQAEATTFRSQGSNFARHSGWARVYTPGADFSAETEELFSCDRTASSIHTPARHTKTVCLIIDDEVVLWCQEVWQIPEA